MTEEESVEQFEFDMMVKLRPRGTNAAVTLVLLEAIQAAANMAVRTATGEIDRANAEKILRDAAELLRKV